MITKHAYSSEYVDTECGGYPPEIYFSDTPVEAANNVRRISGNPMDAFWYQDVGEIKSASVAVTFPADYSEARKKEIAQAALDRAAKLRALKIEKRKAEVPAIKKAITPILEHYGKFLAGFHPIVNPTADIRCAFTFDESTLENCVALYVFDEIEMLEHYEDYLGTEYLPGYYINGLEVTLADCVAQVTAELEKQMPDLLDEFGSPATLEEMYGK
jgi:hypothetical protein